jgi:hypothetical protein
MPGGTVNENAPDPSVSVLASAGPEISTFAPASGALPDVFTVPVIVAIVAGGTVDGVSGGPGIAVAMALGAGAGVGSAPLAPAGTVVISIQRIAAAHAPRFPAKYVIKCLDINGKTART